MMITRIGDAMMLKATQGTTSLCLCFAIQARNPTGHELVPPYPVRSRGYRGQNTVKSVQDEKYSAKSADFLRFLLYLCHVIDDFK